MSSSNGRTAVSKTDGWGFESLLICMAIEEFYFEKLGRLSDEEELKIFFESNYKLLDGKAHWCDGHMNFNSKEDLYELIKICWRGSLKQAVIKDLKRKKK